MKTLFIESKLKNLKVDLSKKEISKLPKNIVLAYSIQYKQLAYNIAEQLKQNKIKVNKILQVLGCSKINTKLPILLIGSGKFHLFNIMEQISKTAKNPEIYRLNNNIINKISDSEINKIKTKRKTVLTKFFKADNIGILVSTKPRQYDITQAINLKNKLAKKHKTSYIFISNSIDVSQFENFQIDSWINTACPGLTNDNLSIINMDELPI